MKYFLGYIFVLFLMFNCSTQKEPGCLGRSIGKVVAKNSKEISSSPFGIQAGTLEDSLVAIAAEIGVKWTRLGASWPSIEKEKGIYSWEETDKAFEAALKNGITPFVTIGGGNRLYSVLTTYSDPKLAAIYGEKPAPPIKDPVAMQAFLKFVKATVERYKDKINYWEVWNEPNHRNYWGDEPNGKEYGQLVFQTAKLIREIDPECKIIAGATSGIDPEFTDNFLQAGADSLIDIISFHNYGAIPEERVYLAVELWKIMKKYRQGIELWQGECGYPSHSSTRDFRGRAPWGVNIQAKWLLRQSFVDLFYCKATLSNYFKLAHTEGRGEMPIRTNLRQIDTIFGYPERGGSRVKTVGVNEKCLLTNPGLAKKTGFYAYQNLCSIWQPDYKPDVLKYKTEISDEGIFYGIGPEDDAFPSIPLVTFFKNEKGNSLVSWWLPWNAQEYLPKLATINLTIENLQLKNPVMVDLISGQVYSVNDIKFLNGTTTLKGLPLADYPIVICEKETVNINR